MKLKGIKKEFRDWDENHQHDYRWHKDLKEREAWIRKHWEVEEEIEKEKSYVILILRFFRKRLIILGIFLLIIFILIWLRSLI